MHWLFGESQPPKTQAEARGSFRPLCTVPRRDRFALILQRRYEAIVVANTRGMPAELARIVANVLASAVVGVVHDAAIRGTLHSGGLGRELMALVDS
jgi:hypothetical protein